MNARRSSRLGAVVLVAAGLTVTGLIGGFSAGASPPAAGARPNIVFVLTDDLAWNLVTPRYMPHVVALERRGVTFTKYFVDDSLCCPSRASILTGLFPHDTRVFTNTWKEGGYHAFREHRDERRTFAIPLRGHGYLTSFMGKYLNGYGDPKMTRHVPRGWSDWHVASNGYPEFHYILNENGRLRHYGGPPPPRRNAANYLTDVLSRRATSFVDSAAKAHKPFLLEVATFAPHYPYTPAPRNAHDFPGLRAPRYPSFDAQNTNPPDWLGKRRQLTSGQIALIDKQFRMRAQASEAVDRLVAKVEAELVAKGIARNTYIVFSSDNGYHMGEHRLLPGKQTAFESDIHVPLIVVGPGVPHGKRVTKVTQNIDLYPTFLAMAGLRPPVGCDGQSLMPLLHPHGGAPVKWPTVALIEHHGPTDRNDPDFENGDAGGNPAPYNAIRISNRQFGNAVYVEYTKSGFDEYYNINRDPYELHNTYAQLNPAMQRQMHAILLRLKSCHSSTRCWRAADPQP
jgi:N-acetylglucosamine-6-sulfatase